MRFRIHQFCSKLSLQTSSRDEGVLSNLEVVVLLLLLKSQFFGFKRSELSAVCSGLLVSKIVRSLLVILVSLASSADSLFAEDGENSGNGLSDSLKHRIRVCRKSGFAKSELQQKLTLILESLTWGWEDTLLTRRAAKSLRCLVSSATRPVSSFDLSSCALTLCICLIY